MNPITITKPHTQRALKICIDCLIFRRIVPHHKGQYSTELSTVFNLELYDKVKCDLRSAN